MWGSDHVAGVARSSQAIPVLITTKHAIVMDFPSFDKKMRETTLVGYCRHIALLLDSKCRFGRLGIRSDDRNHCAFLDASADLHVRPEHTSVYKPPTITLDDLAICSLL